MRTFFWAILTFLCSPVLLLAARFRRPYQPKRIVIIQLGKLGDLLCTTPMFRAIKAAHPEWEVHVVCRKQSSEVLKGNSDVTAVYAIDDLSRFNLIKVICALRASVIVNCMPGAFSSILGLWSLVALRVNTFSLSHGVLVRILTLFNHYNLQYRIRTWTHGHYMKLLSCLNIPPASPVPVFAINDEVQTRIDQWIARRGLPPGGFVTFNLTAGNSVKEWPEEKFAELARYVTQTLKMPVVFSTRDTEIVKHARSLAGQTAQVVDASGFTLEESAALYRRSAAFVSVDTGPLYVAYAVGTPLVIIQGPIHPEEQIPREDEKIVHVRPPEGCEPWVFVSLTPREGTREQLGCARDTSVESVVEGLVKVLGG